MAVTGGVSLDSFLRREIYPSLKAEGFHRHGREAWIQGPHGQAGVTRFHADNPSSGGLFAFEWQYGIVTPALAGFRESAGWSAQPQPSIDDALLTAAVFSPIQTRDRRNPTAFPYRWVLYDPDTSPAIGAAAREVLQMVVLQRLRDWFEPTALATAIRSEEPGLFPAVRRPVAAAMALAPLGARSPAFVDALNELDPTDSARAWLEATSDG